MESNQIRRPYTASPLPFMGQKRNFAHKFIAELETMPAGATIVDLFGGSGILSHLAKCSRPAGRVIYNDFDNFQLRLKSVETTNKLIQFARELLRDAPKDKKLEPADKAAILEEIKRVQDAGNFIDYISVSSQLLFSGKYALSFGELSKETWYNCVRKSDFVVDGYLDGVEIVTMDYQDLFELFKETDNVVFIIDPPYLQTQQTAYSKYWNLKDHLDSLKLLFADRYFYFTSSKSHIIELMEWLDNSGIMISPFKHCKRVSHQQYVNSGSSYEDIMFVRR